MKTAGSVQIEARFTQSRPSANASSARRRSSSDSDAWIRYAVTPSSRSRAPSCSTSCLESQNTRRFSPRYSAAITVAAFATLPT